jgi:hypothetical protein
MFRQVFLFFNFVQASKRDRPGQYRRGRRQHPLTHSFTLYFFRARPSLRKRLLLKIMVRVDVGRRLSNSCATQSGTLPELTSVGCERVETQSERKRKEKLRRERSARRAQNKTKGKKKKKNQPRPRSLSTLSPCSSDLGSPAGDHSRAQ